LEGLEKGLPQFGQMSIKESMGSFSAVDCCGVTAGLGAGFFFFEAGMRKGMKGFENLCLFRLYLESCWKDWHNPDGLSR
jgi:hypothetical protein